jgi:hypothetical protein
MGGGKPGGVRMQVGEGGRQKLKAEIEKNGTVKSEKPLTTASTENTERI